MNRNLFSVTAIASLAIVAATAHAGTRVSEDQMMDACIQKFIAANLSDYTGKVTVQKLSAGYQPLVLSSHATTITVSAYHRTSGEHLGAVTCKVSDDGTVTVAMPDQAAAAKLAKLMKSPVVAVTN